jgi:protocatechuate 3,4-dioxygenase beta subunit
MTRLRFILTPLLTPLFLGSFVVGVLAGSPLAQQSAPSGGSIAGRVVEEGTNTPVADARVMVMVMMTAPPAAGQPPPQPYQANSASDGTFRFDGLPPGRYRVSAQKAGYASFGPGSPRPALVVLQAGGPGATQVIALQRGGVITGRVLSPAGEPMAEARVTAMRRPPGAAAGGRLFMSGPPATTNDLGEFRLHSLAPGEYYLQASPRFEPPNTRSGRSAVIIAPTFYPGTTDTAAAQPVTIGSGATLNGIEIRVLQVPAFAIKGIVVDEAGTPVANAAVMLSSDPSLGVPIVNGPSRTRTAADGTFTVEGIASGSYRLTAAAPIVSKAAAGGPARGSVGATFASGIGGGIVGGPAHMTETMNGVTTEYRFEGQAVVVELQNDHVSGVRITVKQPR